MKWAHTVLPIITVTSTNKSVQHDVLSILEIGRNGKKIFEQCTCMSELLTTVVQYNKCYYDTYYNHNDLYYQLHAFNFL